MKVSTKGRYALRLMLDLAIYNTGDPVALKDIARRQDISEKYLEQIISMLGKAGLVQAIRGSQGGYLLRRDPAEYTVGDILRVTEGDLSLVECISPNGVECDREANCVTVRVWEKLTDAINQTADSISLADLVEWSREKLGDYCI
ncbi:MAG: Rrf2 family transcriptional regulator [Lachnospiraceae bacterium]|nr:Rrf2 family transcriptional regulator [Lachnospiraceae bacterium]